MSREKAAFSLIEKWTHQRFNSANVVLGVLKSPLIKKNKIKKAAVYNSIWKFCYYKQGKIM